MINNHTIVKVSHSQVNQVIEMNAIILYALSHPIRDAVNFHLKQQ